MEKIKINVFYMHEFSAYLSGAIVAKTTENVDDFAPHKKKMEYYLFGEQIEENQRKSMIYFRAQFKHNRISIYLNLSWQVVRWPKARKKTIVIEKKITNSEWFHI